MKKALALIGLIVAFGCVHFYLGMDAIEQSSPTYDEPVHLTAGVVYWKTGQYLYNGLHHPPFGEMWAAIPTVLARPILPVQHPAWLAGRWVPLDQYRFADAFLYHNRVPAERMMNAARCMQLLLSCLLGAAVIVAAFRLGWFAAAVFAGLFWAFSPAFLANGTVVSTDLSFAAFFFGFFSCLDYSPSKKAAVAAGVCGGLMFASKYFALAAPFALALVLLLTPNWRKAVGLWGLTLIVGGFAVACTYRFSGLDVFWHGFTNLFSRAQAGRASFFIGHHSTGGQIAYFPFAFIVKTPIPLLLAFVSIIIVALKNPKKFPAWLWIPPVVFFVLACLSSVQIGHRHILSIYPFLFVAAGVSISEWLGKKSWLTAPLFVWLIVDVSHARPDFLAYFNSIIGGSENGYKYLTDSNVDWGQGLKRLAASLSDAERRNGIYLCYFGVADPHAYGIRFLDIGSDRIVEHPEDSPAELNPTTFAISVTNLQATYYQQKNAFEWLNAYTPSRRIAHSIFVYDFSDKPEALATLRAMRS